MRIYYLPGEGVIIHLRALKMRIIVTIRELLKRIVQRDLGAVGVSKLPYVIYLSLPHAP
ncbi:hypothetical protein MWSIV6_1171 [Methanothermobacter wolfeii]|nr:hypothetical protein MWSIV6_1171 [Methanothermobacter wolfeii]